MSMMEKNKGTQRGVIEYDKDLKEHNTQQQQGHRDLETESRAENPARGIKKYIKNQQKYKIKELLSKL